MGRVLWDTVVATNLTVLYHNMVYLWAPNCDSWVHLCTPAGAEVVKSVLELNAPVNWLLAIEPYIYMLLQGAKRGVAEFLF